MAAGAALVIAAGGRVTDYVGKPAEVMKGHVVATNGRIHDTLVAELGAASPR
jgi:myo-inositol-1(or 4)-monophosphatase